MKEFIEKLIGRLEELKQIERKRSCDCDEEGYGDAEQIYDDGRSQGRYEQTNKIIEIVNELVAEYNNGWIPCSERLPDKSGWFLCTQEYHSLTDGKLMKVTTELVEFYYNKWRRAKNLVVTHWQPLPHPYQPKGEKG